MLPSSTAVLLLLLLFASLRPSKASDDVRVVLAAETMKCSRVVCDGAVNAATTTAGDYATPPGDVVDCGDCGICGRKGFSVCLRAEGKCLCDHFLPESCEDEGQKKGAAKEYCYRQALQKLPSVRPHVKETYTSVDVKQFWLQPYWSTLQPERLVFHYKYKEMVPEYCMGTFVAQNVCVSSIDMEMSQDFDGIDLPLELQIDNEVFDHTEKAEFWITVDVLEPSFTRGNVWVNISSDVTILDLRATVKQSDGSQEEMEGVETGSQKSVWKDYGIYLIIAGVIIVFFAVVIAVYCSCRRKEKQGYVAGKAERA
ncbi:hypothetical protein QR680_008073 [Steinernema hermaphroditum]|uniref:TNFR-Cys domain-containing protein n=1 Tax=Steinernema hermaphroditum TaxID=289476 RepID=A0AA39IHN5_9BILA|nr:hypothetical protein QR680_008073 [Steinernema hermaphroditum]